MPDFSPDKEKNNSSKLNTDLQNADAERAALHEDGNYYAEENSAEDLTDTPDADDFARPFSVPEDAENDPAAGEESGRGDLFEDAEDSSDDSEESGFSDEDLGFSDEDLGYSDEDLGYSDEDLGYFEEDPDYSEEDLGFLKEKEDTADSSAASEKTASADPASSHAEQMGNSGKTEKKKPEENAEKAAKTEKTEKTEKTKAAKAASYKEKILRHKKRRYRRTIFLVVFVMAVLVAAVILWMRRGYTHAELIRISALTADDGASYENLGGNVVQYGNSGAVCVDQRGNTLWDVSYEMQQPITSVSGDVIAIANRSGYYVYVMNTQGLMGTIQTTLPIHSIAASDSGEVAVIMDDTSATWVRLYTAQGREIAYLVRTMEENGYPIAAAVSPDGETLCLSSVSMSNAAVKTNISFYNFGSAGQNVNDHLVQHSDFIDEVIPYLHYIDNTTCVCASDKQLFCFWSTILRSPGSSYSQLPDNTLGVFCGDSFIGVLSTNINGDTQYTLELYNKRGKHAGDVNFTMQYTDIDIAGDKIYIHNEQECQIFTVGGRCLFNGSFEKPIRAMIPGAGLSDLLVVTDGEVDNVRLH